MGGHRPDDRGCAAGVHDGDVCRLQPVHRGGGYSGSPVATTTIAATICLQIAALSTSLLFLGLLAVKGGQTFQFGGRVYLLAAVAGICIGLAEIAYLYLFGGIGGVEPMPASRAIPVIVCGIVIVTGIVVVFVFKEALGSYQIAGGLFTLVGISLFFVPR